MAFNLSDRQKEADDFLKSSATSVLLYGGARTGKTFLVLKNIIERALTLESKHLIICKSFNILKISICMDVFPKVMSLCFSDYSGICELNKDLWCYEFQNGSRIWLSGLDDKKQMKTILKNKYSTVFLNRCSDMLYDSYAMALKLIDNGQLSESKIFCTCIPGSIFHWTYQLFVNQSKYASYCLNVMDNKTLPEEYLEALRGLDEKRRERYLLGQFNEDDDNVYQKQ